MTYIFVHDTHINITNFTREFPVVSVRTSGVFASRLIYNPMSELAKDQSRFVDKFERNPGDKNRRSFAAISLTEPNRGHPTAEPWSNSFESQRNNTDPLIVFVFVILFRHYTTCRGIRLKYNAYKLSTPPVQTNYNNVIKLITKSKIRPNCTYVNTYTAT